MSHTRLLSCFALLLWGLPACSPTPRVGRVAPARGAAAPERPSLLIRTDGTGSTSVGIRLTLDSNGRIDRRGPVLGRTAVPRLVDADSDVFPAADTLHENPSAS